MSDKPNILIFMTDQQRGDTVLPGSRLKAQTPNLDAFGKEAVTFTHAYAPSPHCCPARTSFFTGLYPTEHGVWNNVCVQNAFSTGPNPGVRFWSDGLAEAGYRLAFNGKWHICHERGPREFGWEEGMVTAGARRHGQGVMGKIWDHYRNLPPPSGEPGFLPRPGYGDFKVYGTSEDPFDDGKVVDAAQNNLRELAASRDPWALYIGTLGPHDPYTPPPEYLDLYDPADIELPASFED